MRNDKGWSGAKTLNNLYFKRASSLGIPLPNFLHSEDKWSRPIGLLEVLHFPSLKSLVWGRRVRSKRCMGFKEGLNN
jgi:hypothetical protein